MSNMAIVLYDQRAKDSDMRSLQILMESIITKIDATADMCIGMDLISDLSIRSADRCEHEFKLNAQGTGVTCVSCPKKFKITSREKPSTVVVEGGEKK